MGLAFAEERATLDEAWACAFGELQTNGFSPHARDLLLRLRRSHLDAFDMVAGDDGDEAEVRRRVHIPSARPTLTLIR